MPCALSASIMSSKYAQEGNQRGFSVSTTSGNEMNEEQTKSNNSSTSAEGSVHQVLPVSFRDNATSSLPTTSRSQHSFSIEALVGNNRSHDDDASKPAGTSIPEIASSESWPNQHPLVDLKRIQAYYQQMYSQHFPLKQLNNYLYPLASFTESEASKPNEPAREKDQILAYYANLYLQSSNFYQERYLESLRTFSTDTVQQNSKESIPEFLQRYEKQIIKNEPEEVAQRLLSKENERRNSSHLLSDDLTTKDHFVKLKQYSNNEARFSDSKKSNDTSSKSPSSSDQLPQPQPPSEPSASQPSLLFPGVNKPIDNASQSTLRTNFPQQLVGSSQSVSTSLSGSNLYPAYCDYDLLDLQNKSNLRLAGGNSNSATPNSLHSPQLGTENSSRPSPGGVPNGGGTAAAAAAAAYHLSSMFRKPKRIRTAFSPGQLLRLEEIFEKNRYVVGCERKQLARDLNLSETQIKVWFQNRRTKHKREKHIGVGQSEDHSMNSSHSFHEEKKASLTSRLAPISTSSTSSSSSSNTGYLSHGSFTMPPTSLIYGHFKNQNSTHRTLLAK